MIKSTLVFVALLGSYSQFAYSVQAQIQPVKVDSASTRPNQCPNSLPAETPIQEEPAAEIFELEIDASSATATVYLALEDGQLVPSTVEADWLVAVKRTQFQTNSGTSGSGNVGVYNSASQDFSALTSCEGLEFTSDKTLPASGAPGSLPSSGNEILNAWYDYDMSTHTVTSKQDVYAITNGTQCLKFQILGYEAGRFQVQVSELK